MLVLIGGPLVLAVPILVWCARRAPAFLPAAALVALSTAGAVSAAGVWHSVPMPGSGAFSDAAQALALLALACALLAPPPARRGTRQNVRG